jgi:predicted metal-dependent hydrolase
MMKEDHINFGNSRIDYSLERQDRKSIRVEVYPSAFVRVLAPNNADEAIIREKISSKAPWILKQQSYFISFHPFTAPRIFVSGETHLYLGRQYKLKVIESSQSTVKLQAGLLIVETNSKLNPSQIEKQLNNWYSQKAQIQFEKVFEESLTLFSNYKVERPNLSFRWMFKRWGSCSPKGKITLNYELIKAPKRCIQYVMVHELCHLIHPNHSQKFFDLLYSVYPEWQKVKDRLERFMV